MASRRTIHKCMQRTPIAKGASSGVRMLKQAQLCVRMLTEHLDLKYWRVGHTQLFMADGAMAALRARQAAVRGLKAARLQAQVRRKRDARRVEVLRQARDHGSSARTWWRRRRRRTLSPVRSQRPRRIPSPTTRLRRMTSRRLSPSCIRHCCRRRRHCPMSKLQRARWPDRSPTCTPRAPGAWPRDCPSRRAPRVYCSRSYEAAAGR